MKNYLLKLNGLLLVFLFISGTITAQTTAGATAKKTTIKIKTSAECDMCKNRIEKEMAFVKGVNKADLDLATRVLTVTYQTRKTSPEAIKTAIAKIGYDADDVKADNKAFKKLPECCQTNSGTDCKPDEQKNDKKGN
jgi:periplasmic mercuric ion binding protein